MKNIVLVYITCTDVAQAQSIGQTLLQERLAACINILPEMTSQYWWPPQAGELETGHEAVLLVKTLEKKFENVVSRVKQLHSYDEPCVMGWPVPFISCTYKKWLMGELEIPVG